MIDAIWEVGIQHGKPYLDIEDKTSGHGLRWSMNSDEAIRIGKALIAAGEKTQYPGS